MAWRCPNLIRLNLLACAPRFTQLSSPCPSHAGIAEEAQLPFFDALPPDPTIDDMQRVVVMEKRRPGIPNRWSQSQVCPSPLDPSMPPLVPRPPCPPEYGTCNVNPPSIYDVLALLFQLLPCKFYKTKNSF